MTDTLAPIDPRRAALLVMDYQNGVVDMLGEPDELLSRAADAIALASDRGAHVGYVRVAFTDADLAAFPPTSKMGARGHLSTIGLDQRLRDRGADTVILAGISTSGVVLSTVRDASDRDYRVLVLADATADREPDVHAFLIERIFPRQADVITIAELEGLLSAS